MSHDQLLSDASKPNIINYLENFSAAELHGVLLSHSANNKKKLDPGFELTLFCTQLISLVVISKKKQIMVCMCGYR
jgi:hypothetical protein